VNATTSASPIPPTRAASVERTPLRVDAFIPIKPASIELNAPNRYATPIRRAVW
jgi:hypothetical protein